MIETNLDTLHTLAITRTDQPGYVERRTHPPLRLVAQAIQKRLQPASKVIFPPRSLEVSLPELPSYSPLRPAHLQSRFPMLSLCADTISVD
jgi:hypothetical protein